MADLWLVLAPILLADILNPVLFALLVFLAGSARGVFLSSMALLGHTAAYFLCGIVIAVGFDQLTAFMTNPGIVTFVLELLLGMVLLAIAWPSRRSATQSAAEDPAITTAGSAFVTGAVVNFVGIPFALPYFAVIDQILKVDLTTPGNFLALAAYNLAYMAPFLMVPVLTWTMGENAKSLLQSINTWIERIAGNLMPFILGAVGVALIADALTYLITGESLF